MNAAMHTFHTFLFLYLQEVPHNSGFFPFIPLLQKVHIQVCIISLLGEIQ